MLLRAQQGSARPSRSQSPVPTATVSTAPSSRNSSKSETRAAHSQHPPSSAHSSVRSSPQPTHQPIASTSALQPPKDQHNPDVMPPDLTRSEPFYNHDSEQMSQNHMLPPPPAIQQILKRPRPSSVSDPANQREAERKTKKSIQEHECGREGLSVLVDASLQ